MRKALQDFHQYRAKTEALCASLATEDYVIQSMEDVSPPKWHLAHTTWFFETFILVPSVPTYRPYHPAFKHLFNSYYQRIGHLYPRNQRGLLSRPTVASIYAYRQYVDQAIHELLENSSAEQSMPWEPLVHLGLHHELQHQELLLTDIKHNFSLLPELSIYQAAVLKSSSSIPALEFIPMRGGTIEIGNPGKDFCFDNELPRHKQILYPYAMANRLISNGEYLEFIAAGGYQNPEWWLSEGWDLAQKNKWQAPLYWQNIENTWYVFTLSGQRKIDFSEPVAHVSYYEADAYARFRGCRLPTEAEWEHFIYSQNLNPAGGNFLESNHFHPHASETKLADQFFGELWEWTASAYHPYPGYKPLQGFLGEYNGKFMSNQMVLRGGSCVTPQSQIRATYRNFFQPDKRWQFSGIRLASSERGHS